MPEVPGLNPTLIRSSPWFDPHLGDALNLSATRAEVTAPTKPTFFSNRYYQFIDRVSERARNGIKTW